MPSNEQFPEAPEAPEAPDPAGPLNELTHWLSSAALHCVLGLLIGAFAARLMRRHHLHWSWAPVALTLFVLASAHLRVSSSTLIIAALLATVRATLAPP